MIGDTGPGTSRATTRFEFTARGGELGAIVLVNLLLTILTLGIYSAWAKVRIQRYLYAHTRLDGHAFEYLGDPYRILLGRISAIALVTAYSFGSALFPALAFALACTLALLSPYLIATSSAFIIRNSAYRNLRMGFRSDYRDAYRAVLAPLIVLLVIAGSAYFSIPEQLLNEDTGELVERAELLPLSILAGVLPVLPWLDAARARYVIDHMRYGSLRGHFNGGVLRFYWVYLCFVLRVTGGLLLGVILGFAVGSFAERIAGVGPEAAEPVVLRDIIVLVCWTLAIPVSVACFRSERSNLLRNGTRFGDNQLAGTFEARGLFWLSLTNLLLSVVTLGVFLPWAFVRTARYRASHTGIDTRGLDAIVTDAAASGDTSAIGEEISGFLDLDMGL